MADTKISALSAASALAGADVFPVVQGGVTKKATGAQISALVTTLWLPGFISFKLAAVNFNAANTDNIIPITGLPAGCTRYALNSLRITNASQTLTTATCGLFTAAAAGGVAFANAVAITVSTASDATVNNSQSVGLTSPGTTCLTLAGVPNLYFRTQTAQGAAATADVTVLVTPLP